MVQQPTSGPGTFSSLTPGIPTPASLLQSLTPSSNKESFLMSSHRSPAMEFFSSSTISGSLQLSIWTI